MRLLHSALGWVLGLLLVCWRHTCRYRVENDSRPRLRQLGGTYIYSILHAHQLAAILGQDERQLAAMVSRSRDGDLLVPFLTLRGVKAARGSTRKDGRDKGGSSALMELLGLVRAGTPVVFAVDGPRGPRNYVNRGIAMLSLQTGAPILPTLVLPSRRWFLSKAWDRFQIPKPFCTMRMIFGEPIVAAENEDSETLRQRVSQTMNDLERQYDPDEAQHSLSTSEQLG